MAFLFLGMIPNLEWFIVENPEQAILFIFLWSFNCQLVVSCLGERGL